MNIIKVIETLRRKAVKKIAYIALILINKDNQGYANILDTKAEVLWKMGKIEDAIFIIEKALEFDSDSEYFKSQKEKFLKNN